MRPLSGKNKYLVFSTIVLPAGVFLFGARLFAQVAPAANQAIQGAGSDFYIDAARGLQTLSASPSSEDLSRAVSGAENKSAWDQFGMSALTENTASPIEVLQNITQDILSGVQTEHAYDTAEAQYLSISGVAPEDVQAVESDGNSDIPMGVVASPNPSVGENPDVSWASSEDRASAEDTTSMEIVSTESTSTEISPDAGTSADSGTPASDTTSSGSEMNASSTDISTSSEETIFNAILQGELSSSSQMDSTSPPPPPPDMSSGDTPQPQ